jgi:dihydroxyacetone kinase-like protein
MTQNTTTLPTDFGARWVSTLSESFLGKTDSLGDLDRQVGDGDFGSNIATALRLTKSNIDQGAPETYSQWVTALSRGFLGVGGTSGPLFGMFFRDLARCTSGQEPTLEEFAAGLTAGVATVQRYGKAEVGHKTMVDAIVPASQTLNAQVAEGAEPAAALEAAAAAAVEGAQSTAAILARRGRASYVGALARGVLDPGAAAAAIMIQAAAVAATGTEGPVDTSWITE